MHMYRVAGVALYICRNAKEKTDTENIVSACLLHDMGNILKSDFSFFPEVWKEKGIPYWQGVKEDFQKRYGKNEDDATYAIAKEIGVSEKTYEYILSLGFSKMCAILGSGDLSKEITAYSDARVYPYGVVSVDERLRDGKKRYANSKHHAIANRDMFEKNCACLYEMEKDIFGRTTITPESINSENINPLLEELRKFKIV